MSHASCLAGRHVTHWWPEEGAAWAQLARTGGSLPTHMRMYISISWNRYASAEATTYLPGLLGALAVATSCPLLSMAVASLSLLPVRVSPSGPCLPSSPPILCDPSWVLPSRKGRPHSLIVPTVAGGTGEGGRDRQLVKVMLAIRSRFVKVSRNSSHFKGHNATERREGRYWGIRGRQACWSSSGRQCTLLKICG